MKIIRLITLFLGFNMSVAIAQTPSTQLYQVAKEFGKIASFNANVKVQFLIPSVQMSDLTGTMSYAKPNKYNIHLTGIAFLPKQNPFEIYRLLADTTQYTAIAQGNQNIGNHVCQLITVLPFKQTDLMLAKFWVETGTHMVHKTEVTTREQGTVETLYTYGAKVNWPLPDRLNVSVDMSRFQVPKMVSADINSVRKQSLPKSAKGKIIFNMSNYKIKRG